MSDDDLWRRRKSGEPDEHPEEHPDEKGGAGEAGPGAVSDETQPITGTSSTPPPVSPASPSPYGDQRSADRGQPYAPPPDPYAAQSQYGGPQHPYGAPYQPAYAGGALADHPSATTSMVLGIIGLVGLVLCGGITLVLSPFAWSVGAKAVREIDGSPGRYAGRDRAQAGKIMGIIGTVILILAVLAMIGLVVLAVAVSTSDPSPTYPSVGPQSG